MMTKSLLLAAIVTGLLASTGIAAETSSPANNSNATVDITTPAEEKRVVVQKPTGKITIGLDGDGNWLARGPNDEATARSYSGEKDIEAVIELEAAKDGVVVENGFAVEAKATTAAPKSAKNARNAATKKRAKLKKKRVVRKKTVKRKKVAKRRVKKTKARKSRPRRRATNRGS